MASRQGSPVVRSSANVSMPLRRASPPKGLTFDPEWGRAGWLGEFLVFPGRGKTGGQPVSSTLMTEPAAGWYHDPADAGAWRWWDGATWTDHVRAADDAHATHIALAPDP